MIRRFAPLVAFVALLGCSGYRLVREGKVQTSAAQRVKSRLVSIRGLSFRSAVPVTAVTQAEAHAILEDEIHRQFGPGELVTLGRVYSALGLLPPDADLEQAILELYSQQLAGFYDPVERRMVLVTDSLNAGLLTNMVERITRRDLTGELLLGHELTHALQDQHYGLDTGRADLGEDDAQLARRAVYEGDATLAGFAVVAGKLSAADAVRLAGKLEPLPSQLAHAYPDIPPIIRDTVVFQYVAGVNFVSWAYQQAGWEGVNALLVRPPRSTEQVLHPEKYFVRPEYPLTIRLGALPVYMQEGWEVTEETTLGELIIQILCERFLAHARAQAVASGWDGDRLAALVRDGDLATVWLTAWDSEQDAREFFSAYSEILGAKHPGTAPSRVGDTAVTLEGSRPYCLERRDTKVLAIEGPLEADLTAAADRMWKQASYEATVPWLPIELAAQQRRRSRAISDAAPRSLDGPSAPSPPASTPGMGALQR